MNISKLVILAVVALLCTFLCDATFAQSQRTEHTFGLDDPDNRPPATLDDVAWLVGSWEGEAFGSQFEEVWNPPSAGSMVGFFKLIQEDEVVFYELLLLVEEEGSLSLKVKHFSADFIAWEEKQDYITFKFVQANDSAIHFSGISFYRRDDKNMDGYIVMRSDEDIREEKLVYRRR